MSDLFGPMPLPDRPVLQTADIAAREAAAKQKEIDTRMRERMETSRLQTIHEIGVSKEEYSLSLQELERDYRKDLIEQQSRPSSSYARGTSSRGRTSYQRTQQNNSGLVVNQEKLRLSSQWMRFGTDLRQAANEFVLQWRESDMDMEQGMDAWQNLVVGHVDNLYFNPDQFVSSLNTNAQVEINKLVNARTNWISDQGFKLLGDKQLEQAEADYWESSTSSMAHFTMSVDTKEKLGIDMRLEDIPSFVELIDYQDHMVEQKFVDPWMNPNSRIHGEIQDAVKGRIVSAALEEAKALVPLLDRPGEFAVDDDGDPFTTEHLNLRVTSLIEESELWESLQNGPYSQHFGDISIEEISDALGGKMKTLQEQYKKEQDAASDQWHESYLAGEKQDLAGDEVYSQCMNVGGSNTFCWNLGKKHSTEQGSEAWLSNAAIKQAYEEQQLKDQAAYENSLERILEEDPFVYGTQADTMRPLGDMQSRGLIANANAPKWLDNFDTGMSAEITKHGKALASIDTWGNLLRQEFQGTGASKQRMSDAVIPRYQSGAAVGHRSMSTDELKAQVRSELKERIRNPGEEGALTEAGGLEFARQRMQFYTKHMRRRMGQPGKDARARVAGPVRRIEVRPYQPIAGRPTAHAGLLMQSAYTPEVDEAFVTSWLDMDTTSKHLAAVNAIDLPGYSGNFMDDLHAEQAMTTTLDQIQSDGLINAWELDLESRSLSVQLTDHGAWITRNLDYGEPGFRLTDVRNTGRDIAELSEVVGHSMGFGRAHLTIVTEHPRDGSIHESPSVALTTLERKCDEMTRHLSQCAGDILNGTWQPTAGQGLPKHNYDSSIPSFPPQTSRFALES